MGGNFNMSGCHKLWTSHPDAPVVLMSAGVGITPMLGMLGSMKAGTEQHSRSVLWLHASQNGRQHAFRNYITALAGSHPESLTRRVWYGEPCADDVKGMDNKAPYHFEGRMNLTEVKNMLPLKDLKAQYFFCGPVPWMQSIAKQLLDLGVEKSCMHFESFGPADDILH